MFEKIGQYLRQWEHDPSVTCVVVTGAGKAFCSGFVLFSHPHKSQAIRNVEDSF
jgi:enoyl-CoA hydratase/carnithine racemase